MYSGPADFSAPNPRNGTSISYFLKEDRAGGAKLNLVIQNSSGETIRTLRAPAKKGFNRVLWDLRAVTATEESESPQTGSRSRYRRSMRGSYVLPGEYRVVLTLNQKKLQTPVKVRAFEKHNFSREDREANRKLVQQIGIYVRMGSSLIRDLNALSEKMTNLKKGIRTNKVKSDALKQLIGAVDEKIAELQKSYSYSVAGATGYKRPVMVALRGGTLPEQISRLSGEVSRYQGKPTVTQINRFTEIKGVIDNLLDKFRRIETDDIPKINQILKDLNFPYIYR